jgi:rubrerythrin
MSQIQDTGVDAPYAEFMSRAYAMELEAAERYGQFAEQLEAHNNQEVGALFRKLAKVEALHAKRILIDMRWPNPPSSAVRHQWPAGEAPETGAFEELHYLMQPYHALQIALQCELRAQKYFEAIASSDAPPSVRKAAAEMAEEEREHVTMVKEWLAKLPKPQNGWDYDPDSPNISD